MDINGQSSFLLREADEFDQRSTRMLWHPERKALCLAQNQSLRLAEIDAATGLQAWQNAHALVVDNFSQHARISAGGDRIEINAGRGFQPLLDGMLQAVTPPAGTFTDISIGGEKGEYLAIAYSNDSDQHGVILFHLAQRWYAACTVPEKSLRVCVDDNATLWAMGETMLSACAGKPLPHTYTPDTTRFEPLALNPKAFDAYFHGAYPINFVGLALCSDSDALYVLTHNGSGQQFILKRTLQNAAGEWTVFALEENFPFAVDMQRVSTNRLALLLPAESGDSAFNKRDCPVVQLSNVQREGILSDGTAILVRERYPMLSQVQARFASSADKRLRYQSQIEQGSAEHTAGFTAYPRELLPLKRPQYHVAAMATLLKTFDSGHPNTIWHRLYLEGCIPPSCKIRIYAKVFNSDEERSEKPFIEQPEWLWCRHRSDLAFGRGLVESKFNEAGLFELLLQREGGPVRRLNGRYLQLRIVLEGDGRTTPAIHALKIVYPRFSYQEAYLPEHFRQEYQVDENLDALGANGADVRERMLAAFEGALTPIETQVASSEVLLDPATTPTAHLSWLAEAFGVSLPAEWPVHRQRRWLACSGDLQRYRGTLAGVNLALDIITDGGVQNGRVVVVENFRLRRTMATILGLNMDDEAHPLTLGTGMSGNSIVGESLILADEDAREFLALFAPELAQAEEEIIVENFFDKYAHKVTVLLHGPARAQRHAVEKTLTEQMPAHLQWKIVESDHPFVLGLSPLLAVDTYLELSPSFKRVTLNDTWLGAEGVLTNPAAFSPQDVNASMITKQE